MEKRERNVLSIDDEAKQNSLLLLLSLSLLSIASSISQSIEHQKHIGKDKLIVELTANSLTPMLNPNQNSTI